MIPRPHEADIDTLERALDAADHATRLSWMRSLGKKDMDTLYEAAAGRDVGADFFLCEQGESQVWTGRNSLPAFNDFAKAFAPHSDRIQGYNVNTGLAAWFGGPGHFLVRVCGDEHGEQVIFDYLWEADSAPEEFPALASNSKGTYSLVYGNMKDVVRRVSKDLIISKAYRKGKPEGAFFSLLRPE